MNVNSKMDRLRGGIGNFGRTETQTDRQTDTRLIQRWLVGKEGRECPWSFPGLFHSVPPSEDQKTPLKQLKGVGERGGRG